MQLTTKVSAKYADEVEKIIDWRIENGHSKSKSHFLLQCVMSAIQSTREEPIAFLLPPKKEEEDKVNVEVYEDGMAIKQRTVKSEENIVEGENIKDQ